MGSMVQPGCQECVCGGDLGGCVSVGEAGGWRLQGPFPDRSQSWRAGRGWLRWPPGHSWGQSAESRQECSDCEQRRLLFCDLLSKVCLSYI